MAQAGYKHTIALLDSNKLLWWGSNATINMQSIPTECDLYYKIPDMNADFNPVRVFCSWSKTKCVTYVTIADSRTAELQSGLRSKILNQLSTKIEESNATHEVHPPLIETISKYFPNKIMKTYNAIDKKQPLNPQKPATPASTKGSSTKRTTSKSTIGSNSYYQGDNEGVIGPPHYSTVLKSLRQNPPKYYEDAGYDEGELEKSYASNAKSLNKSSIASPSKEALKTASATKSPATRIGTSPKPRDGESGPNTEQFDTAHKLREIKRKMEEILRIPREHWSLADIEFMKMATEPKMFALLRSLKG